MGWVQVASVSPVGSTGGATFDTGSVGKAGGMANEGVLSCLLVKFTGQHANTVTKIYEMLPDQTERLLLTLTSVNTTGFYQPEVVTHSSAGVASTTTRLPVVCGQWKVVVTLGNQVPNGVVVQAQIIPIQ